MPAPQYDSLPIEDYALIGNTITGALVGKNGSIDWFCAPRLDSAACLAALLGSHDNGHWQIAPVGGAQAVRRRYRGDTLILETEFETPTGLARLTDFMVINGHDSEEHCHLVRIVEGLRGTVDMEMALAIRFYYGSMVPWVRRVGTARLAVAGPDTLYLTATVPLHGKDQTTRARFRLTAGARETFQMSYQPAHHTAYTPPEPLAALAHTEQWWRAWAAKNRYQGPWRDAVMRSLITLKALTCRPTGAIAAALTTSLPEAFGGTRNWDYRYCWLRDATFTLWSMLATGYTEEAVAWREWLMRAVAGDPADLQIVYGVNGERWIGEREIPWLCGYEGAKPVRVGNAASDQFQIDVYGELMDSLHLARSAGLHPQPHAWKIQCAIMTFLESAWQLPDDGIWEMRGGRRHFTHSKVMAWVAFDRAVKDATRHGLTAPVARWAKIRDTIHADVCAQGFSAARNSFTQYYGSEALDASLLMMALVGFLPATDPRVIGTVRAIESDLIDGGLVLRYRPQESGDGLPGREGVFLPCSFWLVDNLVLQGRHDEAHALFARLAGLCNDVGLLSEEYDPAARRLCGNFPQAFTHVALVNSARTLAGAGPATDYYPPAGASARR
ncbi:glycoside hydrolase family 15 protein [Acidiferrobacter sp.]|uniref:glycoside hydrolase family 15 protein n=1 Tax=Acidiferrobacter sp. TaxID=1872107 RepID=UPI00262D0C6C|nr:glycoside hydrolase family 15 protein [Acidiferrobacter sp.]